MHFWQYLKMQRILLQAQQRAKLSKVPRQVSRFIGLNVIRFSTSYTTPQEISFLAHLVELCAPQLRELSIEFCSCFRNDEFMDNSTAFGQNSKFHSLLAYAGCAARDRAVPSAQGIHCYYGCCHCQPAPVPKARAGAPAPAEVLEGARGVQKDVRPPFLPEDYWCGVFNSFYRKEALGEAEIGAFYQITDAILGNASHMHSLRVLTLINPPEPLLGISLPDSLEVLILQNGDMTGVIKQLARLRKLYVLSLNFCDLKSVKYQFLAFLRSNSSANQTSFEQNLQKYYGTCARHTGLTEIYARFTDVQLFGFRQRLDCQGVQFLDLQNCSIDLALGAQMAEILKSDAAIQLLALKGNPIDLTMHRRDEEPELAVSYSSYKSITQFMQTSLSDGFRKKPSAAILAGLRQYSIRQAEQYELLEMRLHFIPQILAENTFLRKVWMDSDISPCLCEFVQLKCRQNQARLYEALLDVCADNEFYGRKKENLLEYVQGKANLKLCVIPLLSIPDFIKYKKKRVGSPGKAPLRRSTAEKANQQPRQQQKLEIPKRPPVRTPKKEEAIIRNIQRVKDASSRVASSREVSRMSAQSNGSAKVSKTDKNHRRNAKASTSRLTSSPVSSSPPAQKSERSSRSSSKSRANTSTFRVESTIVSDDLPSRMRSQTESDAAQRMRASVLRDKEDSLKIQELLKPFTAEYETPQRKARTAEDRELTQKIVDMLFEALVFTCQNDYFRAKHLFLENQDKILEYCGYIVNDINGGRLEMGQVRQQLFSFIESYI